MSGRGSSGKRGSARGKGRGRGRGGLGGRGGRASSAQKRPAPAQAGSLVSATSEELAGLRNAWAEIMEGKSREVKGKRGRSKLALKNAEDPTNAAATAAYLREFGTSVLGQVEGLCEVRGEREQREAEELHEEIVEFTSDLLKTSERVKAKRARVLRLAQETCAEQLQAQFRASGGEAPGAGEQQQHPDALVDADGGQLPLSGMHEAVLKDKVDRAGNAIHDLVDPLLSFSRKVPERARSLRETVEAVEASVAASGSATEALLGKAPPPAKGLETQGGVGTVQEQRAPDAAARLLVARSERSAQLQAEKSAEPQGQLAALFGT